VGYQQFRGPYCLHLQGEVTGDGGEGGKGTDIGLFFIFPTASHFTLKMETA